MRYSSKLKTADIKTFKLIIPIRMKTFQVASERSRTDDVVPNRNILISKFQGRKSFKIFIIYKKVLSKESILKMVILQKI